MGDTLVLDFQTNLLKIMQQVNSTLSGTNDLLNKNQKNLTKNGDTMSKTRDYYTDIEKKQKNINSLSEKFKGITEAISTGFLEMAAPLLSILSIAGFFNVIKAALQYKQTFMDLSYRMGEGSKAAGVYTGAMHGIVQATGISMERSQALVKTLAEFRVATKDIKQLGIATAQFAEVTGMSDASAARLTGELSRTGKVGAGGIKQVLTGMMNVQHQVGLTEKDMEELGDAVITNTKLLQQMGKTEVEIEKFAKGTTALVGAFAKVGLSVQDAQGLLEKFLDPGKFEDSALLFANLGTSLGDVMNGETMDPALMGSKLKALAVDIKSQTNPIIQKQMAEMNGMSYDMVGKLAKMSEQTLQDAMKASGGDMKEGLANALSAQTTIGKEGDQFKNKTEDNMASLAEKAISAATPLIHTVIKMLSKIPTILLAAFLILGPIVLKVIAGIKERQMRASVDTSEHMKKGISGAMEMGSKKGADMMTKNSLISNRTVSEDKLRRIKEGSAYSERMMRAEYFHMMAQTNMGKGGKVSAESTSLWLKELAMGSKPASALLMSTKQHNAAIMDKLKLTQRDNALQHEAKDFLIAEYKILQDEKNVTIKLLEAKEKITEEAKKMTGQERKALKGKGLTGQEKEALKEQRKDLQKYTDALEKAEKDKKNIINRETSMMKHLSVQQLKSMKEEAKLTQDDLLAQKAKEIILLKELSTEKKITDAALKQVQDELKNTKLTAREKLELMKTEKGLRAEADQITNAYKEQQVKVKGIHAEMEKQADLQENIQNTLNGKKTKTEAESRKPWFVLANHLGAAARHAGASIKDGVHKLGASIKQHVAAIKEHLKPAALAQGLAKGLGGLAKGMAGLGASMIVMTLLRPIFEKLKPAIEQIQKAIMPLVDKMLPIIMGLMNALMPILFVLINALMPPILVVLGWLLKILGILISGIATLARKFGAHTESLDTMAAGFKKAGEDTISLGMNWKKIETPLLTLAKNSEGEPTTSNGAEPTILNKSSGVGFSKQAASEAAKNNDGKDVLEAIAGATARTADNTKDGSKAAEDSRNLAYAQAQSDLLLKSKIESVANSYDRGRAAARKAENDANTAIDLFRATNGRAGKDPFATTVSR